MNLKNIKNSCYFEYSLNLHRLLIASNIFNVAEVIKKSDLEYLYINDYFFGKKK